MLAILFIDQFLSLNDGTESANEDYAKDLMTRTRVYECARGSEKETRVTQVDESYNSRSMSNFKFQFYVRKFHRATYFLFHRLITFLSDDIFSILELTSLANKRNRLFLSFRAFLM